MLWAPAGPPGRGENAPSQREPVGNIKAVSSFQTQHRLDFSMRTHAHYILANKEGSGYNKPVVQLCCCAECSLTRTGPWGAPTPCGLPQLCFRHNSTRYRKKLQEVFRKTHRKSAPLDAADPRLLPGVRSMDANSCRKSLQI